MKFALIAAAALMAGPALAQTTTGAQNPDTMQTSPSASQTDSTPPTATPTDQNMTTPAPNSAATTQTGDSGAMTTGQQGSMPMQGGTAGGDMSASSDTSSYPMCSSTVTDHCRERSNAAGARVHGRARRR